MKQIMVLALLMAGSASMAADVTHQGYTRRDGTYVQPHHQSAPNSTNLDNYSTRGNVNPYTGQAGHVAPNYTPAAPVYTPQTTHQTPQRGNIWQR
jgi:hypothetical protein